MKNRKLKKIEMKIGKNDIHRLKSVMNILQKNKIPLFDVHFDIKNPPDLFKIKPILYHLINRFEEKTSIIFFNLPYCILPDAEEHIINLESDGKIKSPKCKNCKFNSFCGGFSKNHSSAEMISVKDIPKEVSIELTTKCNLDCDFCFSKAAYNSDYFLNKEQGLSILEQTAKLGIQRIRFTGGEPLLDKNLPEYAENAKKLGLEVWINTNGYATDMYSAGLLRQFDSVLIPLHETETESKITGKQDSAKRKIQTIKKIKAARKGLSLRAGTVIMKRNLNDMEIIHGLVKSLGIKWELYRLIGNNEKTINKPEDFQKLYKTLLKIYMREGKRFFVTNAFPFCFFENSDNARLFSLGGLLDDGRDRIVINAKGEAKPTYYSQDKVGTWKDISLAWKNETMRSLRNLEYLPDICKVCKYRTLCKGGSRMLAKNISRSYSSKDPLLEVF